MKQPQDKNHKSFALVLGGGGARGLAHIGVYKVLERYSLRPDLIAGTSMGGLLGAVFAAGYPAQEAEDYALKRARKREIGKLVDLRLSNRGLLKGARIYNVLTEILGPEADFKDLKIPLAVVATDKRTGREVVLCEGRLADAVRATISLPGVFQPVIHEDVTLVDGGILNNVPTSVARALGAERMIAVDVMPSFVHNQPGKPPVEPMLTYTRIPGFFQDLWEIQQIMISAMTDMRLEDAPPDLLIQPAIPADVDLLLGFERAAEVIAAGEQAAEAALPAIEALLEVSGK
jgi:NTE family protein